MFASDIIYVLDNHASFVTKHNKFVTNGTVYVVPFKVQSKENPPKTAFFEARGKVVFVYFLFLKNCNIAHKKEINKMFSLSFTTFYITPIKL